LSLASQKLSVLLVDDHALVRRGVRRILEDAPDISIVGETGDGVHAIRMARELQPRIVIMDCRLSGVDGFEAARSVVESCPQTAVVILSMHSGKAWIQRAIDAGAHAFVPKSASELDLVLLLRKVAAGERLLLSLPKSNEPATRRISGLSARELQVLRLIVDGKSTKEIASNLGLSVHTVSVHRARIARSLGLRNTAELVTYALRNGLADLPY